MLEINNHVLTDIGLSRYDIRSAMVALDYH
jgi:uncharacterized protein YjiS (DUF1127 family)